MLSLEPRPFTTEMTASAMPEERQACLDAGMNDVLVKPFPLRELERLLQRWSNKH